MHNPNDIKVNSSRQFTGHTGVRREPMDGWIWKQATGTAAVGETSFSFDDILPDNAMVDDVYVEVSGTAITAATTVALGYSGTTAAFLAATSFTSSMNSAGVKATTPVRVHLTAEKTPLITFSADLDTNGKLLAGIHYVHCPAIV